MQFWLVRSAVERHPVWAQEAHLYARATPFRRKLRRQRVISHKTGGLKRRNVYTSVQCARQSACLGELLDREINSGRTRSRRLAPSSQLLPLRVGFNWVQFAGDPEPLGLFFNN